FQLRRIRVPWPFALPEVEDPGRIAPLLGRLAPVARGQRAVLLPRPAVHGQSTVVVARDAEQAHRRRLVRAPRRQRELPPQPFDQASSSLGLDRLAELLV